MEKMVKIAALFIVLMLAFVLLGFLPKKAFEVRSFALAEYVNENMQFIPKETDFGAGTNLYFITELSGLEMKNGYVSYKVDAKIVDATSPVPENIFDGTVIEETKQIQNRDGRLTVAGRIFIPISAKNGQHVLKITVTDNYGASEKKLENSFRVNEWKQPIDIPYGAE